MIKKISISILHNCDENKKDISQNSQNQKTSMQ